MMVIVPMDLTDARSAQEAAALLVRGFAACAEDRSVAGWISGRHDYARVWELYSLLIIDRFHVVSKGLTNSGLRRSVIHDMGESHDREHLHRLCAEEVPPSLLGCRPPFGRDR